jgi:GT2 family glycosyltransferase
LVSLIIPTKDAVKLLRVCVSSVLEKTSYPQYEVLIVDNRSTQRGTRAYLADIAREPRVRVLAYDRPYNFAALNNFAAGFARGQILCFLNNDVEVIAPDWLEEMVRHALRPEIGPVGAMLYYPDDTIQHAGVIIGLNGTADHAHKLRRRGDPGYCSRAKAAQNYAAVTAACMVVRRELFDAVEGFDAENFGIAYNDIDLCLRLWDRGYRTLWTPFAELYHHESATLGAPGNEKRREQFLRESATFLSRWARYVAHDPFYNPNLSKMATSFALAFPPAQRYPWLEPS